jgi:rhodanese-related sulfurtransferase
MSLYDAATPNPAGHRDLTPAKVSLPPPAGVRLIDVREPHEFVGELGHIPGAELVPLSSVMAHAATWDKAHEYLLICRSGGRSANAAIALTRAGFAKAINLVGGMIAWNQAGLKTER